MCERWWWCWVGAEGKGRAMAGISLRQSQEDVFHQHGADHHFLTVDCQLGGAFFFGRHGNQHQATASHRSAGKPVNRIFRRRNRRTEVKVQRPKVGSKDEIREQHVRMSGQVRFNDNSGILKYKIMLRLRLLFCHVACNPHV